jgi:hypothetical protein
MDVEDIRVRLDATLRARFNGTPLAPELWDYLVREGKVAAAKGDINALVKAAWDVWCATGVADKITREAKGLDEAVTGDEARPDFWGALSEATAHEAGKAEAVRAFRATVLGGRLLAREAVPAWVAVQAKKDGPATMLLEVAVPRGHTLRLVAGGYTTDPPLSLARVPAGSVRTHGVAYADHATGLVHWEAVAAGGVLAQLGRIAKDLARHWGLSEAAAATFVLTGATARIPPVRVTVDTAGRGWITLTVHPAVLPARLAAVYRRVRREALGGRRFRALSPKHLALAAWITGRPTGEPPAAQLREWNRARPRWLYRDDRLFRRDAKAARQRLLGAVIRPEDVLEAIATTGMARGARATHAKKKGATP